MTEKPRHCTECGAEIYESMGACNSADVLAFMLGQQTFIRERCGLCAMRPYRAKNQKGTNRKIPRRTMLKKALYLAPAILTLPAHAAFAARGSGFTQEWGKRRSEKGGKP